MNPPSTAHQPSGTELCLRSVLAAGCSAEDVGVVTPYMAQAQRGIRVSSGLFGWALRCG